MARHWMSICAFLVLGWSVSNQALAQSADEVIEKFSIRTNGDTILVPVELNGKKYTFLVDTCAGRTMCDRSLVTGKPTETSLILTPSNSATVESFDAPDIRVGKLKLRDSVRTVVGYDLGKFRLLGGDPIMGILGVEFLGKHVVQMNFDRGELLFLKSIPPKCGEEFTLFEEDGLPAIFAKIEGYGEALFALDTGMIGTDSGTVEQSVGEVLIRNKLLTEVGKRRYDDISGSHERMLYRSSDLTLGDFKLKNPVLDQSKSNNLSLYFISRFNVTFDFPNRKVYLKPNRHHDRPDRIDRSGLRILKRENKVVVEFVDKGGPGEKAGFRSGDVLNRIGALDAEKASMFELRLALSAEGKDVSVIGEREGKRFESVVKLPK